MPCTLCYHIKSYSLSKKQKRCLIRIIKITLQSKQQLTKEQVSHSTPQFFLPTLHPSMLSASLVHSFHGLGWIPSRFTQQRFHEFPMYSLGIQSCDGPSVLWETYFLSQTNALTDVPVPWSVLKNFLSLVFCITVSLITNGSFLQVYKPL